MSMPLWRETPPPPRLGTEIFSCDVATPSDLTVCRGHLHREALRRGVPEADDADLDRLLIAYEELASNGLRHGRLPVRVTVAQDNDGWLIDVTDSATDRAPTPATGRDPSRGGLGLYLIARLSARCGWWNEHGRKHVWALVRAAHPR